MDLELNDTQRLIRDTARNFAREKVAPTARQRDREELFPVELLREMAGLGLMGVNLPAAYGGAEAGTVAYALALMEIAEACASTAVTMAVTNMCGELINATGNDAQRERYLPRLTSGEALCGAFALSESHAGSDAGAMRTTAVRKGDTWVINGSKQWISHGSHAGIFVVWARTSGEGNRGLSTFLVEAGAPGLVVGRHEEKMGLRGSSTVALTFEDLEVPADQLLGVQGEGFKYAMMALNGGRIGIGSQAVGVARAALAASVQYAKDRQAFGQPIGEFGAIREFLANMKLDLSAAELLVLRAAALKEQKQPFAREASMAKLFASEMSERVCDRAIQIHGGYGYIDEFPVERLYRDARVQQIYEGTSEIQRLVIARETFRAFAD